MTSVIRSYSWNPIPNGSRDRYLFGDDLSSDFRSALRHPAVYRWHIFDSVPGDRMLAYVGEAEHLARRVYQYNHPGPIQRTNLRLKQYFDDEIRKGASVALEVLDFAPLTLDELVVSRADLHDKAVRRMIESLAVLWVRRDGFTLLNL